ncbi:hypothetical protein [Streptomyces alboflavus]|uniref:hypothetical protein n=1 Tax=Streptomyces alboflavus TaxID=67267 RepID=UPI0013315CB9|nr:hypothetical protein [Streptomyces alboflavus]
MAAHRPLPAADATLWQALFTRDTFVRRPESPAAFAAAERRTLRSYPGKLVHDEVTGVYEAVAVYTTRSRLGAHWAREERMLCEEPPTDHRGWELPSKYRMADIISQQVLDLGRNVKTGFEAVEEALDPHGDGPRPPRPSTSRASWTARARTTPPRRGSGCCPSPRPPVLRARHGTRRARRAAEAPGGLPRGVRPHRDYPELQRRFGLVVDLRFTMPSAVADGAKVRVAFDDGVTGDAQLNARAGAPGRRSGSLAAASSRPPRRPRGRSPAGSSTSATPSPGT